MEELYNSIGISRQAVHQASNKIEKDIKIEENLVEEIKRIRVDHPKMGSRPLYFAIQEAGIQIPMGINRFENFVKRSHLLIGKANSKYPKTSDGLGRENYKNLCNGLNINNINQLIVADITYYEIPEGRTYLFVLKDAYSQRLLSVRPSKNMYSENAVNCLIDMINMRKTTKFEGCIHHSDNGSQYNSKMYKEQLKGMNILISRAESCKQNGSIEQMNHIIKNMYLESWSIGTFKELCQACKELVYLKNEGRPIKQLGYLTPIKFEEKLKKISASKRPIKTLFDFEKGFFEA